MKLIFGCGYLGFRVARLWLAAGETVCAVTRSQENWLRLEIAGVQPILADVTRPESLIGLPAAETVLYAVGYDRRANRSIHEVYAGGLRAVLDRLPRETRKIVYVSSTGVYAQSGGAEVDENSLCQPQREGGCACLAAEQALAEHPRGAERIILRLAGIYGPGRIPLAELIERNEPIPAPADGYLNLIHVDDAAAVVLAAESRARPPALYCVSDGQPILRCDYYAELARLLGAAPPVFAPPDPSSPAAGRAESNKRVRSALMFAELAPRLAYPSYREGLAAIVAHRP